MAVDHYENFPVASILLPRKLRQPVSAIYAFARSADDIADEGDASPAARLAQLDSYRTALESIEANRNLGAPIFRQLAQAIRFHDLPIQPFRDLLDAFSQDVIKSRYATFDELLDYCRLSADPVGRLMLHLYRADSDENLVRSDYVCSSLQLINFWQDVAIDWQKTRIYLPQADLARFGISEAQIAAGRIDDNWRSLMRFQVDRARSMMLRGAPLGAAIPGRLGLEVRTIVAGGLRILEKIEAADFDVFSRRPVLQAYDWPLLSWRALFWRHRSSPTPLAPTGL